MEPYLCVCMSCGLYMKCSTPMIPEKHMCNPNNKAIEKNIKECRAILDTLLGSGNSDAPVTVSMPRPPPPPPLPPCPIAYNQKERDEIAATSLKFVAVQEELALKIKGRAEKIEEAARKAEEDQKAKSAPAIYEKNKRESRAGDFKKSIKRCRKK